MNKGGLRLDTGSDSKAGTAHLHKGKAFEVHEGQGSGLFLKDIATAGKRVHPGTHEIVDLPRERLVEFAALANKWRAEGNKIPFPNGHEEGVDANLGFWPGPFFVEGDTLFGIVEPKDEMALKKIADGTLDAVSLATEIGLKGQSGEDFPETIVHIAATNYPVVTDQGEFIALSTKLDSKSRRCFVPEALALSFKGGDEMDREKLIKKLGLKTDATDGDIILALQKQSDEKGADLDKKITAGIEKALSTVGTALEGHGLTLSGKGEALKIEKAEDAPEETAAEKAVKVRLASLEAREGKAIVEDAERRVLALIEKGQLPPGAKETAVELLSVRGEAMGLSLSSGNPVERALNVIDKVQKLLEALPKKVDGSKLRTMETFKEEEPTDARKQALARGKAATDRRKGVKPKKEEPAPTGA